MRLKSVSTSITGNSAEVLEKEEGKFMELTNREKEVLILIQKGFTNKEIAKELSISTHTAKAHVSEILRKTGAKNRLLAALKFAPKG